MPLIHSKSKQAVGQNIKREMQSGAPQKQAIAIALSVQRKAQHKAMGGEIMSQSSPDHSAHELAAEIFNHHKRKMLAQGGMVKEDIDQVIPNSGGAEDFLSSENDDSHMLHNNEEFLSDESHMGNEKKRPNIPDTEPKPVIESILDRMRLKKARNLR